jgi:hypothetical protein
MKAYSFNSILLLHDSRFGVGRGKFPFQIKTAGQKNNRFRYEVQNLN